MRLTSAIKSEMKSRDPSCTPAPLSLPNRSHRPREQVTKHSDKLTSRGMSRVCLCGFVSDGKSECQSTFRNEYLIICQPAFEEDAG
jgi:hypothetical protein